MENTSQSTERPRFRSDLVAQPIEEEGVRYVDVTDPASGQTFRFYDVEYSIACAMDGARDVDNLAEWTRAELGIEASPEELVSVINTLAELGYLEGVTPTGQGIPELLGASDTEAAPAAEAGNGAGYTDETAREVAAAYDHAMETAPTPAAEGEAVPQPVPHPNVQAAQPRAEEAEPPPIELEADEPELPPAVHAAPPPPPMAAMGEAAPAKRPDEAETSFAGILDDAPPTPPPPAPAEPRAARSPRPVGGEAPYHLDDEGPTQVPSAHVEEDEEDVSVDLSAHLALDKHEVQEAVRSSRVHAVPPIPSDERESESEQAVKEALASTSPLAGVAMATPEPRPVEAPPPPRTTEPLPAEPARPISLERAPTLPQAEEPRVPPAVPLPSRPPVAQPPRVRAARPIEPTRTPPPAKAPAKKSSALSTLIVVLLLAAVLVAVLYAFKDRIFGSDDYTSKPTSSAPPPTKTAEPATVATVPPATAEGTPPPAKPTEPTAAAPSEPKPTEPPAAKPAEAAPPTATVRADSAPAAEKTTVSAPAAGQVAWVAEKGAAVEAGAPVVKLLGFAKWEAKLKDGVDRGGFYAKKLAEAEAKGDAAAADAAQKKVDEKKAIVEEAQKELAKLILAAPSAGKVKPLVAAGAEVKAGAPVAEIGGEADKPQTTLRASFDAGAAAAKYVEGKPAVVAAKDKPDKQFAAVVEKVDGSKVDVKLVAAGSSMPAAGDEVVLLPPK